MRIVADTDVVVAAMRSPRGASAEILRVARRGGVTLLVSLALGLEYAQVCLKPEHREAAGLTERQAVAFVDALLAMAEPVTVHYLWRPQLRDAGDEMVLETAINGRANALVTFNLRDFGSAPERFGIELMLPRDLAERIR